MTDMSQEKLDGLVEDLAAIKQTIGKSRSLLQQIFLVRPLRMVGVLGGVGTIAFSLAFHFLLNAYGSHQQIPLSVKAVLYSALGVACVAIGIIKNTSIMRSARHIDSRISYPTLYKEFFSPRVVHYYLPVALMLVGVVTLLAVRGHTGLIVPAVSIGIGMVYLGYAGVLGAGDFLVAGYWLLASGYVLLLLPSLKPTIGLCVSLGFGFLIMGLVSYLHPQTRSEE